MYGKKKHSHTVKICRSHIVHISMAAHQSYKFSKAQRKNSTKHLEKKKIDFRLRKSYSIAFFLSKPSMDFFTVVRYRFSAINQQRTTFETWNRDENDQKKKKIKTKTKPFSKLVCDNATDKQAR